MIDCDVKLGTREKFLTGLYCLFFMVCTLFFTSCKSQDPLAVKRVGATSVATQGDLVLAAQVEPTPVLLTTQQASKLNVNEVSRNNGGTPPQFKGGESALSVFIDDALKYPEEAKSKEIEGRVYLSFIVTEQGKIEQLEVVEGIAELNAEALRIVGLMPEWIPATQHGKNCAAQFSMSITFRLPRADWVERK